MADVNKVILLGRVGKDPEIRSFDSGGKVANFSLATTAKWKKDGELQERTEWHRCKAFGKLADVVESYVGKGKQLYVEGEIQYREYEKDGIKRYATDIKVFNLVLLGGKSDGNAKQAKGDWDEESDDDGGW